MYKTKRSKSSLAQCILVIQKRYNDFIWAYLIQLKFSRITAHGREFKVDDWQLLTKKLLFDINLHTQAYTNREINYETNSIKQATVEDVFTNYNTVSCIEYSNIKDCILYKNIAKYI